MPPIQSGRYLLAGVGARRALLAKPSPDLEHGENKVSYNFDMRAFVLFSAFAIAAIGFAQSTEQKLRDAHFVSEKANAVTWSPDGNYLGYTSQEASARTTEVGIYNLRNHEGKILFKAGANQQIDDVIWLAGGPVQVVTTSEKTSVGGKPIFRMAIWVLDGKNQTAKQLWTEDVSADQNSHLSIETSPTLTHAIVTPTWGSETTYYVITLDAKGVVISPDIRKSIHDGQGFAGWTVDGTALTPEDQSLTFRQSNGGTRALWLTPNVKSPQTGTLVSPQAELAWLHPTAQPLPSPPTACCSSGR